MDHNGDIIAIPAVKKNGESYFRHIWSIVLFTPTHLSPERLTALHDNFQKSYNTGTWKNEYLDKIGSLTPTPLLSHNKGIGKRISEIDLERLLKKFYPTFAPRTGWGSHTDHQPILAGFWPKGKWSLENSNTFGVPMTWMSPQARNEYKKHQAKANKKLRK